MRHFLLLLALVWPACQASAAACAVPGGSFLINGFDTTPSACTGTSEISVITTSTSMFGTAPGTLNAENSNVQGDFYGRVSGTVSFHQLTITSGNYDAGVTSANLGTHDFLF